MNLEQIVKETVAKIVAEKELTAAEEKKREEIVKAMKKDFKGPAPAMYAIATDKAKKLAEDGIDEAVPTDERFVHYLADENVLNTVKYKLSSLDQSILSNDYVFKHDTNVNDEGDVVIRMYAKPRFVPKNPRLAENEDHEVSMAQSSLNSILRSAMELKAKIGNQEINIPAWIQDHITNSENFIDQASQGYHEYSNGGDHGEMDEAKESNDDKIAKYEKYTYTLDGKIVKPEITFLNNILKAMLDNKIYNIGAPENGKVELTPESGKKGTYTEEMDEANLGHNELSSIEPEGRFWIVKYGTEEKVFDSENKARAFYDELNKPKGLDEWTISRWQHYAGIK